MTAKEALMKQVSELTETQALHVLESAQISKPTEGEDRVTRHRALMERAAALRATQTEVVDAAALVREARDEMEKRAL